MNLLQAIFLGIVQGLAEFIPVSSSGHLILSHEIFGIEGSLAFDVALHGGTLLALIVFFYKDIVRLAKSVFVRSDETRLAWLLAMATIPAVIVGVALESSIESSFRSVRLVALSLVSIAIFMLIAEWYAKKRHKQADIKDITRSQALSVGLAQAVALIPGISRSGSTITMGILVGMNRKSATRFSFLLGIPVIFGAFIKTMLGSGMSEFQAQPIIFTAGALSAFLSGLLAIHFLIRYLSSHSLAVFAWYRIALAIAILIAL